MADTQDPLNSQVRAMYAALIFAALALNWLPHLDALAQLYLTDTISSNAIVFGVVRTLNGLISVVQSSEIGIGVAGITIGEIFDPVNDLIERFSGLLLFTLTALGVQQVILFFTTSLLMKIVFSIAAVALAGLVLFTQVKLTFWFRLALTLFILRFLLTLEVGFVWLFDWVYFNATGEEALSVLEASAQFVQTLKESVTNIDVAQLIFGDATPDLETSDIGTRISESVVTLIVGMLFKSIFIPLGTLFAGYKLAKLSVRT
jgi:hypothetical protein